MSNYNVKLTPDFIVPFSEGDLDSSILNGKSIQRTINMLEVDNVGYRKIVSVNDGENFDNVTFQNSSGVGTFQIDLTFTGDQLLAASTSYDSNGFVGVGAIVLLTPNQVSSLNNYGYPYLVFDATWQAGSYVTSSKVLIFSADNPGATFTSIAVLVPEDNEGLTFCLDNAIWNMPLVLTNFVTGGF